MDKINFAGLRKREPRSNSRSVDKGAADVMSTNSPTELFSHPGCRLKGLPEGKRSALGVVRTHTTAVRRLGSDKLTQRSPPDSASS